MNKGYNRMDYLCMRALDVRQCYYPEFGVTLYELAEICEADVQPLTMYKRLEKLRRDGVLDEGVPVGRAKSYYLTDEGKKLITREG